MSNPVETLQRARESFVRKRRILAEQMMPAGAATSHFGPSFSDVQAAIEAIDRAIADEERLPEGYAAEESTPEISQVEGTNITNLDFDPA